MGKTIWVVVEYQGGEVTESSLELVCEGRRLADLRQYELCAVIIGYQIGDPAEILSRYGVESLYLVDDEVFEKYHPELLTNELTNLIKGLDPDIVLLPSTVVGQDLAPRVAARLRTHLVPDCDKLDLSEGGQLLLSRLIYQNKVHSVVSCPDTRPQMATVVPGISKLKELPTSKEIRVVKRESTQDLKLPSKRMEITKFIKADPKTIDISDAMLIVSGGKGVKDEASFQLIRDLADVLEATVAGSRMAVDNQWIDRTRQIGQSGKTVSPELMISCGVSGASAHVFGMRDTKSIIAINTDKAAPIMKQADLAVVGDLHEILPELISRLKSSLEKKRN